MPQLFANNATSVLAGAITTTSTSLTLATGSGAKFPSPTGGNYFVLTLYQMSGSIEMNHEIVKCTARTGDVLTIVRAQEGTTARSFNSNDPVSMRLTAGGLTLAALGAMDATASLGAVTLLATLTPTSVASVNALNVFNSSMDNYVIVGNGLGCTTATNEVLQIRLATGGVLDTGSNYITNINDGFAKAATNTSMDLLTCGTAPSVGSFCFSLFNVNDSKAKSAEHRAISTANPGSFQFYHRGHAYLNANPVSGVGLFWSAGSNFIAGGAIRVYGYKNT